jgi:hypothetical protein
MHLDNNRFVRKVMIQLYNIYVSIKLEYTYKYILDNYKFRSTRKIFWVEFCLFYL